MAGAAVLARGAAGIARLVSGGDDYEILCTVPEARAESFAQAAAHAGVPLAVIGQVVAGTGAPRFLDARGKEIALTRLSYSHF